MLELDLTSLTPELVFKASGHVQRFADWMVKDEKTGVCYRADKLLCEFIEAELQKSNLPKEREELLKKTLYEVDGYDGDKLGAKFKELNVVSEAGNPLSAPYPFNLMFSTMIGPTGKLTGYLRPETAQGIFVNFKRLLDFNGGQVPFACATIGQAFRNEIAPRSGLLRVREFTLAEIEHFMNPNAAKEEHPKLKNVIELSLPLLSRELQGAGLPAAQVTIGEALAKGTIINKTLAYYIGRTFLFMRALGLLPDGIRFRQHMHNEMAHYAADCWDCELLTSYGWVECVGLADRSCYDLNAHSKESGVQLEAFETFKEPIVQEVTEFQVVNKDKFKKLLKQHIEPVTQKLSSLPEADMKAFQQELDKAGQISVTLDANNTFVLTKEMIQFKLVQKKISGRHFTPAVIEPSFGIGRIIYCMLEHAFWVRKEEEEEQQEEQDKKAKAAKQKDEKLARIVFSFPPTVAPYKTTVFPLQQNDKFDPFVEKLSERLTLASISHKVDVTGQSIGRRYARTDDIGVPFAITVDFESLENNTVTLRERDSCRQIRANVDEVVTIIAHLVEGRTTWEHVLQSHPEQKQTASEKVGKK